jgi:hypothetical protein
MKKKNGKPLPGKELKTRQDDPDLLMDSSPEDFADADADEIDNDWLEEWHMASGNSQHLKARRIIERISEEREMRKAFDDYGDFDKLSFD